MRFVTRLILTQGVQRASPKPDLGFVLDVLAHADVHAGGNVLVDRGVPRIHADLLFDLWDATSPRAGKWFPVSISQGDVIYKRQVHLPRHEVHFFRSVRKPRIDMP